MKSGEIENKKKSNLKRLRIKHKSYAEKIEYKTQIKAKKDGKKKYTKIEDWKNRKLGNV